MLEADGLMDIVQNLPVDLPAPMAEPLLAAMQTFRGNAPREDCGRGNCGSGGGTRAGRLRATGAGLTDLPSVRGTDPEGH